MDTLASEHLFSNKSVWKKSICGGVCLFVFFPSIAKPRCLYNKFLVLKILEILK